MVGYICSGTTQRIFSQWGTQLGSVDQMTHETMGDSMLTWVRLPNPHATQSHPAVVPDLRWVGWETSRIQAKEEAWRNHWDLESCLISDLLLHICPMLLLILTFTHLYHLCLSNFCLPRPLFHIPPTSTLIHYSLNAAFCPLPRDRVSPIHLRNGPPCFSSPPIAPQQAIHPSTSYIHCST